MSNSDFVALLPAQLPAGEPYYYLSKAQRAICEKNRLLRSYASLLPGWIPHRRVADALGFSHYGIENALKRCNGIPYVWCTEFENVHSYWNFDEPDLFINGRLYSCSEAYYQQQKPFPFDAKVWDSQRDEVMRIAVREKFAADSRLRSLLLSTEQHPLISVKKDVYWGVTPSGVGENRLAQILMDLRLELSGK